MLKNTLQSLFSKERVAEVRNLINEDDQNKKMFGKNLIVSFCNLVFNDVEDELIEQFIYFWTTELKDVKYIMDTSFFEEYNLDEFPFYTIKKYSANYAYDILRNETYYKIYKTKGFQKYLENYKGFSFWREYLIKEIRLYNLSYKISNKEPEFEY